MENRRLRSEWIFFLHKNYLHIYLQIHPSISLPQVELSFLQAQYCGFHPTNGWLTSFSILWKGIYLILTKCSFWLKELAGVKGQCSFAERKSKLPEERKSFNFPSLNSQIHLYLSPPLSPGVVDKVAFLLRLISSLALWTTSLCLPEKTLSMIPPPSLSPSQSSSFLRVLV